MSGTDKWLGKCLIKEWINAYSSIRSNFFVAESYCINGSLIARADKKINLVDNEHLFNTHCPQIHQEIEIETDPILRKIVNFIKLAFVTSSFLPRFISLHVRNKVVSWDGAWTLWPTGLGWIPILDLPLTTF